MSAEMGTFILGLVIFTFGFVAELLETLTERWRRINLVARMSKQVSWYGGLMITIYLGLGLTLREVGAYPQAPPKGMLCRPVAPPVAPPGSLLCVPADTLARVARR